MAEADLAERLYVFYRRWNPENLGNIQRIASTFLNREQELWTQMAHKYGPDAVTESLAALERSRPAPPPPPPPPPPPVAAAHRAHPFGGQRGGGFGPAAGRPAPARRGFHDGPYGPPRSVPPAAPVAAPPLPPRQLHNEVLAEICGVLAMPRAPSAHGPRFDGAERSRESAVSTRNEEAVCARRALEPLSPAGRRHLNGHGGLLSVVGCVESQPIQDTVQLECSGTNFWGLSL